MAAYGTDILLEKGPRKLVLQASCLHIKDRYINSFPYIKTRDLRLGVLHPGWSDRIRSEHAEMGGTGIAVMVNVKGVRFRMCMYIPNIDSAHAYTFG